MKIIQSKSLSGTFKVTDQQKVAQSIKIQMDDFIFYRQVQTKKFFFNDLFNV